MQIITINFNDLKSISQAEIKKLELENKGYSLFNNSAGLNSAVLIYKK